MGVYTLNIVGESYRQEEIKRCQEGESLILKRQPKNKYDSNAVAVLREKNHKQIGYLSRDNADWVARIMDDGDEVRAWIKRITGGEIDKPSYGVIIDIDTTPGSGWEENKPIVNEALGRTVLMETKAEEKKTRKGFWKRIFGG